MNEALTPKTIVAALEALDLHFPRVDKEAKREFDSVRKALEQEGKGGARKKNKRRGITAGHARA